MRKLPRRVFQDLQRRLDLIYAGPIRILDHRADLEWRLLFEHGLRAVPRR